MSEIQLYHAGVLEEAGDYKKALTFLDEQKFRILDKTGWKEKRGEIHGCTLDPIQAHYWSLSLQPLCCWSRKTTSLPPSNTESCSSWMLKTWSTTRVCKPPWNCRPLQVSLTANVQILPNTATLLLKWRPNPTLEYYGRCKNVIVTLI